MPKISSRPMNVLVLTRYGTLGASSRLRFEQFAPYLNAHGVNTHIVPLLTDTYLGALYASGGRQLGAMVRGYLRRLSLVLRARRYDLIWLQNEVLPWIPAWLERFSPVPYVVDYDDATFHRYDLHPPKLLRWLMGGKIDAVMRHARVVTAGNEYLMDRARQAGARAVRYVPTVIDLARYPLQPGTESGSVLRIGWIGSPMTAKYLDLVRPVLHELTASINLQLVLVGAGNLVMSELPIESHAWREDTEVSHVQGFDIGIMPLPDTPWERGKCGYKLIQYMGCAKPVIASPVGINSQIVTPGENGFLATTPDEWRAALLKLAQEAELRARLGQAGRRRVEARYSLTAAAPDVLAALQAATSRQG